MRTDPASSIDEASLEPGVWRRAEADAQATSVGRNVLINLNAVTLTRSPQVTVVVPTRTAENGLGRVLDQLGPMVAQLRAEIIFVVDGHNGSFDSLVTTARTCPVPVRALCRRRGPRRGDRSSAVIEGARHARGAWALVLNAGQQHPPRWPQYWQRWPCAVLLRRRRGGGGGSSPETEARSTADRLP